MTGLNLDYDLLQPIVPFRHLLPSHLDQLLAECEILYLFAGDVLFEKGQFDDFHYYLLSGELEAEDEELGKLTYQASSLFPLENAQPRGHRVSASTAATVLKVSRERLDQLLTWSQTAEYLLVNIAANRHLDEDTAWLNTILQSNLFLKVPPTNVDKIFQKLSTRVVSEGEVIVREGELGDSCYFIKEGVAEVSRYSKTALAPERLAMISEGRCFGEDALLQETVRNATVTMKTDGVLMVLKKNDFLQLLRKPEAETLAWQDFLALRESYCVIDVRSESEYAQGHLNYAINIPLNLLSLKSRALDTNNTYLIYCDTGSRSTTACYFLEQTGIRAMALSNGVGRLSEEALSSHWTQTDYLLRDGQVIEGH